MAVEMETWTAVSRCDSKSLAMISIYIASYAAGAPESHRSIAEVAGYAPLYLLALYRAIYDDREQLLDSTMGPTVLPFPPRPASTGLLV